MCSLQNMFSHFYNKTFVITLIIRPTTKQIVTTFNITRTVSIKYNPQLF